MKKKTNVQIVEEDEPAKPRKYGPEKQKTQVTIRVDSQLMNEVYAEMKANEDENLRITDLAERGFQLALYERRHEMSDYAKQVRFIVNNATREQQVLIRGLAIAMVEADVYAPLRTGSGKTEQLSLLYDKLFDLLRWFLESRNREAHATECLKVYGRFGKRKDEDIKPRGR